MKPLRKSDPRRIGPYEIQRRLGQGGMGTVYLGQTADGQDAAVKVLKTDGDFDEWEARDRFRREALSLARVQHPCLVPVLDSDTTGELPWIATEYVKGKTLKQWVDTYGALSDRAIATLVSGLAEALAALHDDGIVHRDLKPGNIVLTDTGPVIIDFGISLLGDATRLTADASITLGSLSYLAPEALTRAPDTPARDIFALGGVLLFAATSHGPVGEGTVDQLKARALHGEWDLSELPQRWRELVTACLSTDPARRPTAGHLCETVEDEFDPVPPLPGWLTAAARETTDDIDDRRPGDADVPKRPRGRGGKRLVLILVAVIVVVTGTAAAIVMPWWGEDGSQERNNPADSGSSPPSSSGGDPTSAATESGDADSKDTTSGATDKPENPPSPPHSGQIVNVDDGLCLTARSPGEEDTPSVYGAKCGAGDSAQQFSLIPDSTVTSAYRLRTTTGQCVYLYASDWKVHQNPCTEGRAWRFTWKATEDGWHHWSLEMIDHGGGRCMQTVPAGQYLDGASCADRTTQHWRTHV